MQRNLDIPSGANNKNISWVVVQFLILITQGCCELFELQVASWGLRCCSARVHVMCPCVFFHKFQLCLPLLGRAAPVPRTRGTRCGAGTDTGICSSRLFMSLPWP